MPESTSYMLQAGINFKVTGQVALSNAMKAAQDELRKTGAITSQTYSRMKQATDTYYTTLQKQFETERLALGQSKLNARRGAMGDVRRIQKQFSASYMAMEKDAVKSYNKIAESAEEAARRQEVALAVASAALVLFGKKLASVTKDAVVTAARAEELDVVLRNMSHVLSMDTQVVKEYEESIKALNIRTDAARETLLLFMRMNLDVAESTKLARIAQDAAVISMEDSSDALQGILHGIMTLQPRVLRTHGIIVNLDMAYREYTESLGTTVDALTMEEKQEIALQEVLKQGVRLQGAYESAMETASKRARSLKRETYESARIFGEALVPALGAGVDALQKVNDWFQALPGPLQHTVSIMTAFSAVMAMASGTATLLSSQLGRVRNALIGINVLRATKGGLGFGLGSLALPIAGITAAVGLGAYLKGVQKEQQKQAASALDTAKSYVEYARKIDEAKASNYGLVQSIWDLIEAQRAFGEAPSGEQVQETVQGLITILQRAPTMPIQDDLRQASDLLIEFATDEEQVLKLVEENVREGALWGKTLQDLVDHVVALAKAEQQLRTEERTAVQYEDRRQGLLEDTDDILLKVTRDQKLLTKAIELTNAAMADAALPRYVGFLGGLAGALGDIRSINQEMSDIRQDFIDVTGDTIMVLRDEIGNINDDLSDTLEDISDDLGDTLKDINKDLGKTLADISESFKKMVPDATEDDARRQMGVDAWDEWARRWAAIQDDNYDAAEQGWLESTANMVKGTKWALMQGETTYEWMARLREGFYAGDEALINAFALKQTAAWRWMEIQRKEAADKEIAEAERVAAEKRQIARQRAIEEEAEARERALKQQQEAEEEMKRQRLIAQEKYKQETALLTKKKNEALLQLSLELAERSGMLKAWADEFVKGMPESMREGMSAFYSEADNVYALLSQGLELPENLTGLPDLLENMASSLTITEVGTRNAANAFDAYTASLGKFAEKAGKKGFLYGTTGMMVGIGEAIDEFTREPVFAPTTALERLFVGWPGLLDEITEKIPGLTTAMQGVVDETTYLDDAWRAWFDEMVGHSIIPELIEGITGFGVSVKTAADTVIVPAIERIATALENIPTTITITITKKTASGTTTTTVGGGGTAPPFSPPPITPPWYGGGTATWPGNAASSAFQTFSEVMEEMQSPVDAGIVSSYGGDVAEAFIDSAGTFPAPNITPGAFQNFTTVMKEGMANAVAQGMSTQTANYPALVPALQSLPKNIASEIVTMPPVAGRAGGKSGGGVNNNMVNTFFVTDPAVWSMAWMSVTNQRQQRFSDMMG